MSLKFHDWALANFLLFASSTVVAENQASQDLVAPEMTTEEPAAGRRVRQVAPEYKGTEVYHALYLPTEWKPGGKYSVLVEYTGNKFPACGSTGEVKDANLGYGLTGGEGFIWVSMPYIEIGRQKNAVRWWGDRQATIDYCKSNLPRICQEFGGNSPEVIDCRVIEPSSVEPIGLFQTLLRRFQPHRNRTRLKRTVAHLSVPSSSERFADTVFLQLKRQIANGIR